MGLNKRHYSVNDIKAQATRLTANEFHEYMTNSDAHIYTDEECRLLHTSYLDSNSSEQVLIYEKLKNKKESN